MDLNTCTETRTVSSYRYDSIISFHATHMYLQQQQHNDNEEEEEEEEEEKCIVPYRARHSPRIVTQNTGHL